MADAPDKVIHEFETALLQLDYDQMASFYEEDAIFTVADMGIFARGTDSIRKTFEAMSAVGTPLGNEIVDHPITISGDYAFGRLTGSVRVKTPDGQEVSFPMDSREVFHRGSDGNWRYVADIG